MHTTRTRRHRVFALAAVLPTASLLAINAHAAALQPTLTRPAGLSRPVAAATLTSQLFASGARLTHRTATGQETVADPDDITLLGRHIFVGFQNGVGPQGEPSPTGNVASTVVELGRSGRALAQWDIVGKCDGLTADPTTGRLIATVNEDANSAVYLINPVAGTRAIRYRYSEALPSRGGTDAISVYRGMTLISASAPGTTGMAAPQPWYPAVYRVVFDASSHVAVLHPYFYDERKAIVATTGAPARGRSTHLALTDPDSNEVVPAWAPRFAGDFMLTSQGDKEQIFVRPLGRYRRRLSVVTLSDSVDDTAWASDRSGAIYTTNNGADTIDKITGPFRRGEVLVADTPCDAGDAPSTCPGPGFSANYLGRLNPRTGVITRLAVSGAPLAPRGMLFIP